MLVLLAERAAACPKGAIRPSLIVLPKSLLFNPAVEAQAIDRTHRIGQTRPVFACRLIARDTVEEKVLELQKNKRALADAIINADNSLISSLKKEDLELLLG